MLIVLAAVAVTALLLQAAVLYRRRPARADGRSYKAWREPWYATLACAVAFCAGLGVLSLHIPSVWGWVLIGGDAVLLALMNAAWLRYWRRSHS